MTAHPNHPTLETSRFLLRTMREEEIPELLELAWRRGKQASSLVEAREIYFFVAGEYAAGRCLHWVIEEKAARVVVGCVGYYRGFENSQGEVGYVMRAAHRGRGVMTEVLPAVLDYGFRDRALSRIIAVTRPDNSPSVALLARAGFLAEGDREDGYRVYALSRPC